MEVNSLIEYKIGNYEKLKKKIFFRGCLAFFEQKTFYFWLFIFVYYCQSQNYDQKYKKNKFLEVKKTGTRMINILLTEPRDIYIFTSCDIYMYEYYFLN